MDDVRCTTFYATLVLRTYDILHKKALLDDSSKAFSMKILRGKFEYGFFIQLTMLLSFKHQPIHQSPHLCAHWNTRIASALIVNTRQNP